MSIITKKTAQAFITNANLSQANTVVNNGSVFLHGNLIARKLTSTKIEISFCGWVTRTTADRINAIVMAATGDKVSVGIKQGKPELRHSNGYNQKIDDTDFVSIDTLYF